MGLVTRSSVASSTSRSPRSSRSRPVSACARAACFAGRSYEHGEHHVGWRDEALPMRWVRGGREPRRRRAGRGAPPARPVHNIKPAGLLICMTSPRAKATRNPLALWGRSPDYMSMDPSRSSEARSRFRLGMHPPTASTAWGGSRAKTRVFRESRMQFSTARGLKQVDARIIEHAQAPRIPGRGAPIRPSRRPVRLAVRSYAIGKPAGAVCRLLVRNPRGVGAPDSLPDHHFIAVDGPLCSVRPSAQVFCP